ncbi:MAG: CHASE2 domain-containing protein, partial [Candidatus Zixiibacteriota bacterium]
NAVLNYDIALATFRSNRTSNPDKLFENSVTVDNPLGVMEEKSSLLARKVFLPAEKLLQDKPFLGFDYDAPDEDRVLRHEPMIVNYEGYYYPSQALLAAATYLKVPPDQIVVEEGKEIRLGKERRIPINDHGEYFIRFNKQPAFIRYSAADVLSDSFNRSQLKGKLVFIGVDDYAQTESFRTPVVNEITPLQIKASIAENIINNNMVEVAKRASLLSLIVLLFLGGICAFVMPRLNLSFRLLVPLGLLFILANVNYFTLTTFNILPETMYIALELILFAAVSPLLDMQVMTLVKPEAAPASAKKTSKPKAKLADFPEPPVREIRSSSSDPENQPTTALDYRETDVPSGHETHGTSAIQKTQALDSREDAGSVKESDDRSKASEISSFDHQTISLDDEPAKEQKKEKSKPTIISPESSQSRKDANISDSDKVRISPAGDITHLGRYQVESVLGKGAMGLVYKGIDPAINRPVALKTIRLDFVNDPDEMAELKERLHREAQAAGKLSHPNIVTIYDVGSEGQLQYIAMEYLEGQTLEQLIKRQVKFNYRIIAQIIQQICAALEYAHERG